MHPRQVHRAPGRPQERDGGGPQPGPRDGRQVRGKKDVARQRHEYLMRHVLVSSVGTDTCSRATTRPSATSATGPG